MVLKGLLLNFPRSEIHKIPSNITITEATIEENLTLHDFHAIIIDATEVLKENWWPTMYQGSIVTKVYTISGMARLGDRIKEQIETGGITFCFSSFKYTRRFCDADWKQSFVDNYFFCPIDLGVVNDHGDTFYPKFEELRYFTPLLKHISPKEIGWSCYFSKIPENTRVLGVNRAGYSVFTEVSLGAGKLVMLPQFKNRAMAATTIVNEIIPQMLHEEEFTFVPKWLPDFSPTFEKQIRGTLNEVERAKKLLYTKDKALKKAVAFAFKKLGFKVDILADGTLPDLRIFDGEQKAIVEVKGHENRQATRRDVLQLLGYLSETDIEEKGIVVSNHEFSKNPRKRGENAFTEGAIQLGEKMGVALISSVSLYEVVMEVVEKEPTDMKMKEIRDKIIAGLGVIQLP